MMFDYQSCETIVPEPASPEGAETVGGCRGIAIRPGFDLILADVRYLSDAAYKHDCSGHMKFHYKLSGDSFIKGEDDDYVAVEAARMSCLVMPSDSIKRSHTPADTYERSVTLVCNKEFASNLFSDLRYDVPTSVAEFCRATPSRFSYLTMFLPAQLRAIAQDLLSLSDDGPMESLMLESKALELLYFTCKELQGLASGGVRVRARDERKVQELCDMLDTGAGVGMTIAELCRHFAWNESQMMECFKQVTGTTISHYRNRVRMNAALRQLQTGEASITEIALDAGFEHPSNFTAAFKRTFGYPPKLARARAIQ